MRSYVRTLLCGTAAIASLATAGGARAQSDAPQVAELIVTAQKRSESVQKVPAAITAVGAAALQERGIEDPSDLQFVVPSMQAGKLLGSTAFTIRGVGLNQGSPGVAVHVDGVYQPRSSMGDLTQIDIARVEVMRGPQGTLYGRNANGGVINFVTEAPTGAFGGYALASYASYNETRLQGVVNIPVSDRVRTRLVLDRWNRDDGFVENVTPGGQDVDKGETLSARLRVSADLTDALTLDLSATGLHGSGPTNYFTLHNLPTAQAVALNPFLAGAIVPLEPHRTSANDPIDASRSYASGAATLAWQVGGATIKSISSYSRLADENIGDDDSINLSAFPSHFISRSNTFSEELNVSGSLGPVDAVVGAFYMRDDNYTKLHYEFPQGIFPLPPNSSLQHEATGYVTKTYAAFADATWRLSDRLRLLGGVRYSRDEQRVTQDSYMNFGPAVRIATCPLQTNEIAFTSTTPRLGAQYDLSADSNVYATFSKGFKIGGFNPYSCNNQYNPEKLTAYEIGIKNRLFDNTLTLNASAFYYDYTDLQLSQVVGLIRLITNAAAAEVKGAELEAVWQPDIHWTINGNLSLLDAKYTDFTNIDSLAPTLGPQDVSGHYLNNAPKQSVNVGVAYRTDPLSFGRLTARADLSYRSDVYFREFNGPLDEQKAYSLLNLALIWDSSDEKYRVRLYATNVTDEAYIMQMDSSDNFGSRFVAWGAPRQVGIELKANF